MRAVEQLRSIRLDTPIDTLHPVLMDSVQEIRDSGGEVLQYPFGFLRVDFTPKGTKEGRYLHVWSSEGDILPHKHSCCID